MTLRSWIKRISRAAYYKLGMRFPYSKVRVWAMRKLGYYVGTDVYFPSDLIITQNFVENISQVWIGDRVAIGPRVMLLASSHANASNIRSSMNISKHSIRVEDDCWIGAGAIILNGVTIGKGAVIGAGSVVTKDVEPYSVNVGNPARKIRDIEIVR